MPVSEDMSGMNLTLVFVFPFWQVCKYIDMDLFYFLFALGRIFNGSGKPIDNGPAVLAEDFLDIQGIILSDFFNELEGVIVLKTLP